MSQSWLKSYTNEEMQDKLNKEKKNNNIKLTKFEIMELLENNNIEFEYNKNVITIAT